MAQKSSSGKFVLIVLLLLAGACGWYYWSANAQKAPEFYTTTVNRGDITQTVTATGIIKPFLDVLVSSQISGYVNGLFVDFNSKVKKGQVLATLLPDNYKAALMSAEGDLANSLANYKLQKITLARDKVLLNKKLMAQSDYDSQEALVEEAAAQIEIKQAAVDTAKGNLSYCAIRSPIDGFVISRLVDIGNSVAASLSSPTLFEIGNDLTKMQIDASVAEADIGNVAPHQDVNFTVDAYPNREFHGHVYQIRNAPQTQQNVVIYDVMISVANDDLALKPGMTANVFIVVARRANVVKVGNSGIRFRLPDSLSSYVVPLKASDAQARSGKAAPGAPKKRALSATERRKMLEQILQEAGYTGGTGAPSLELLRRIRELANERGVDLPAKFLAHTGDATLYRTVYRIPPGEPPPRPEAVRVHLGITDGADTEVLDGLKPGDVIVTGLIQTEAQSRSPFGSHSLGH